MAILRALDHDAHAAVLHHAHDALQHAPRVVVVDRRAKHRAVDLDDVGTQAPEALHLGGARAEVVERDLAAHRAIHAHRVDELRLLLDARLEDLDDDVRGLRAIGGEHRRERALEMRILDGRGGRHVEEELAAVLALAHRVRARENAMRRHRLAVVAERNEEAFVPERPLVCRAEDRLVAAREAERVERRRARIAGRDFAENAREDFVHEDPMRRPIRARCPTRRQGGRG